MFIEYVNLQATEPQNRNHKILFSGIQPTGSVHVGNYFGAIQRWIDLQNNGDKFLCSIADLHSITLPQVKIQKTKTFYSRIITDIIYQQYVTHRIQSD